MDIFSADGRSVDDPDRRSSAADEDSFRKKLAINDAMFEIPSDKSIVDILRKNNVEVAASYEFAFCGTYRTAYLEKEPDHCDMVLDGDER